MKKKKVMFVFFIIAFFLLSLKTTLCLFYTNKETTSVFKTTQVNFSVNDVGEEYLKNNIKLVNGKINLPVSSRNGYSFNGYKYFDKDSIIYFDNEVELDEINGKVIYACWDIKNYSITYNLNKGELLNIINDYTIESDSFSLPTPTRDGYTFLGWTGSNGDTPEKNITINKGSYGNKEYIANWEANTYTITYDLCGGTVGNQPIEYSYTPDSDWMMLPIPEKQGSEFLGWTGSNGDTPDRYVSIPKGSYGDRYYKANWEVNLLKVKVYSNIDGVTYENGVDGFMFDVYVDGELVAQNVSYFEGEYPSGTVVHVTSLEKEGYYTFFDNDTVIDYPTNIIPNYFSEEYFWNMYG